MHLDVALIAHIGTYTMNWSHTVSRGKPKVFDPVGQCIYCGAVPPTPLTKEHILPQGLGGGLILPQSSCGTCREITQKFEERCLRNTLLPYRLRFDLVRHEHEIKRTMEIAVESEAATIETKVIPRLSGPHYLLLPVLEQRPGLLVGKAPGDAIPYHWQFAGDREQLRELTRQLGGRRLHLTAHVDIAAYLRMVAKIAHSYAVGQIGLDGFNADLRQFILGHSYEMGPFLVGNSSEILAVRPDELSHQVGLGIIPWGPIQFVRVRVRLFAHHRSPAYDVIVGRLAISAEQFESRVRPAPAASPAVAPQSKSGKTRVRVRRG